RVADRAARRLGVRIVGVDASPEMLALARRQSTPGAEYHLVTDGRADDLPDACADAAMCNHVLASLPDEQTVLGVLGEIHRLLRRGAPLVVLTTDPACAGIEYASLCVGESGVIYGPGQPLTVRLRRTDGTWQTAQNHAWPPITIRASWNARGSRRPHSTIRHRTRRRASPTRTTCTAATGPPNGGAHRWW
ncbi:class I SAM-dependent methyltransferase, partial [Streptomyces sp. NPDC089922]